MRFALGETLKRLRQAKGLTQEQAAEALGVSPQAVSRWETDAACPDTALLPGLAMFYGVSLDELFGMDRIRQTETLRGIHTEALELAAAGDAAGAAAVLREGLRLFPDNGGLQASLVQALACLDDPEARTEAIRLSERLLQGHSVNDKTRSTVAANLLFLYRAADEYARIPPLIKALPHFWESREFMAAAVCERPWEDTVRQVLAFFCGRLDPPADEGAVPAYIQFGAPREDARGTRELLDTLKEQFTRCSGDE